MKLSAVLFDMDGTIVHAPYDWPKIKKDLGTCGKPILQFLEGLDEPERSIKRNILEDYEDNATKKAILVEGIPELLDFLLHQNVKTALVTNNSEKNVKYLINKFNLNFDIILSRECGLWKPSGSPFITAMRKLNVKKHESCVVGDSLFDVYAAIAAEISPVFILNKDKSGFPLDKVEVFNSINEIKARIAKIIDGFF